MKSLLIFAISIVMIGLLTPSAFAEDYKIYKNTKYGFSFEYPAEVDHPLKDYTPKKLVWKNVDLVGYQVMAQKHLDTWNTLYGVEYNVMVSDMSPMLGYPAEDLLEVMMDSMVSDCSNQSNCDILEFDGDISYPKQDGPPVLDVRTKVVYDNGSSDNYITSNLRLTIVDSSHAVTIQQTVMNPESYGDLYYADNYRHMANTLKTSFLSNSGETNTAESGGGCLIATATYGSEMAPQVQQLRELRDNQLLNTESGTQFMGMFNDIYYSFSPVIADYERENPYFKEAVKLAITPMISTLSLMENAKSESEVLSIGISVIALNLGMYLGVPAIVVIGIRKIK
jgi:hypothetical protein|tara:strand:+ start:823 stop:1839 length:1017 start_codon:yes stop_codon:yes gene_type:complete